MRTNGSIVDDQGKMNNFAVEPRVYVDEQGDRTGFTPYAELLNGRLAMIGFLAYLLWDLAGYSVLRDVLHLIGY